MDPLTRWEAAAITNRGRRPRPGTGRPPSIDLRDHEPAAPPAPEPTPDTLLVPLDAWNRMLAQLGNLHEAGRDLAEARERAAKAETEAEFLRERVADLRERLALLSPPGDPADRAASSPPGDPADRSSRDRSPAPTPVRRLVRSAYTELRARVRR